MLKQSFRNPVNQTHINQQLQNLKELYRCFGAGFVRRRNTKEEARDQKTVNKDPERERQRECRNRFAVLNFCISVFSCVLDSCFLGFWYCKPLMYSANPPQHPDTKTKKKQASKKTKQFRHSLWIVVLWPVGCLPQAGGLKECERSAGILCFFVFG